MCNGKLYGKSLSTVNVSVNCSKAALNECVKKKKENEKISRDYGIIFEFLTKKTVVLERWLGWGWGVGGAALRLLAALTGLELG